MKKVYLKGPFLTQSGYGHHARTVLRALKTRPDLFDIYLHPIPWGKTSWLWEDNEERREIDALLEKTIEHASQGGTYDASIQVTIPNEWEKLAPINIGVTAGIETTKVSANWIEKSFLMDKILTISKHSVDTYVNTVYEATNNQTGERVDFRVQKPVECVSYPVLKHETTELDLNLTTKFNFLAVSQISPRKNAGQLFEAFIEEFGDNEDVGLIVKANMAKNSLIDRRQTLHNFKAIMSKYPDRKCKIYLLHGYLNDSEMAGLYTHPDIKAIVSTTHGEGFGLPLFEAAYYGLPVIATDWSGHLDFLYMPTKQKSGKIKTKPMFSRVSYTLSEISKDVVWKDILVEGSAWAYPEQGSIKTCLSDVYKDHGRFKKQAKQLQAWVCENFNEEKQYAEYVDQINSILTVDDSWKEELEKIEAL